jgi:[ribosomal protein S5]-alanine N-acetyltransferase
LKKSEFYRILDDVVPGCDSKNVKDDSSKRVCFREISMDGLDEMHGYSIDERFYEYLEFKPFKTIEDTRHYLQKLIDLEGNKILERTAVAWFVRRIKDNRMIGTARLVDIDYKRQSISWGYGIDPELWGEGYIFEIQEILKEYIFEKLNLNRLSGITMIENERTKSSLLAAGCSQEGIFREYYKKQDGTYSDAWMYSILAEDYFTNRQQVENENSKERISKKDISKIIAKELNDGSIDENSDMGTISNWDSLSHISVILAIEKEIGFPFKPKEIAQSTSVENIYNIVNKMK